MQSDPPREGLPLSGEIAGTGGADAEPGLREWRVRALSYVLWIAAGIGAVPVLWVSLAAGDFVPLRFRLFALAVLALTLVLALARRLPHNLRAWAFLLTGYALSAMMFAASGLHGGGRHILIGVPLYALVLVGPRAGWAAAGASLALYASVALLSVAGRLSPALSGERFVGPRFWILQGTMLVLALLPVMVLLTRFVGFLRGVLAAERRTATRLAAEARERQRLERVLLETGDRERRTVGHHLHDGPCQQITAALLRCKVAEKAMASQGIREGQEHIRAIAQMLDASVGEIHDLARGLSPPELSPASFPSALGDLARRVSASGPVECRFSHDGVSLPADPAASSQLFQIAREAVANALRHAAPNHIEIELARAGEGIRLRVQDDGSGMAERGEEEGMGLRIMRHRAELAGGSLSVGPGPGRGTLVTCSLPLLSPGAQTGAGS